MSDSQYFLVSGVLFTIVGIAHLYRVITGIPVMIDTYPLPMWASYIATIVPAFLGYSAFRLLRATDQS